jgi:hypothetical protein
MPKARSSILKENLRETRTSGKVKGVDSTTQFLRRGFWKYRLQMQDGLGVTEVAAAVIFQGSGDSHR